MYIYIYMRYFYILDKSPNPFSNYLLNEDQDVEFCKRPWSVGKVVNG